MKEDILEQIVEEYLTHLGYFVRHNVKFKPDPGDPDFKRADDSNHSDIDVLAVDPKRHGPDRVLAVSCKSWQAGFRPKSILAAIEHDRNIGGASARKRFRELAMPKWSEAFRKAVTDATGTSSFTYVTAVSYLNGDAADWENYAPFREAMNGNPIRMLEFKTMLFGVQEKLTQMLASTDIGRMIQIVRAAKIKFVPE